MTHNGDLTHTACGLLLVINLPKPGTFVFLLGPCGCFPQLGALWVTFLDSRRAKVNFQVYMIINQSYAWQEWKRKNANFRSFGGPWGVLTRFNGGESLVAGRSHHKGVIGITKKKSCSTILLKWAKMWKNTYFWLCLGGPGGDFPQFKEGKSFVAGAYDHKWVICMTRMKTYATVLHEWAKMWEKVNFWPFGGAYR